MTTTDRPSEATPRPETTTTPTNSGPPKVGKPKKGKEVDERVPITVSVSADFARRLKVLVSALEESAGEYVESRLTGIVKKDLKKIMEEMA